MEGLKTSSTEVTFLLLLGFWNSTASADPLCLGNWLLVTSQLGSYKNKWRLHKMIQGFGTEAGDVDMCWICVRRNILPQHVYCAQVTFSGFALPCHYPQQNPMPKPSCRGFMFSSIAAFRALLVESTHPFQGGPCSPWSLTRWSESILQKAKVECCKPWYSPAKGQGQSLSGCRSAYRNHISLMAFFCSQWSRTSCDVYHWLPRYHLQLSHGSKAKLVLLSLDLQEYTLTTLTLCLW